MAQFPTRPVAYAEAEFHKTSSLGITTLVNPISAAATSAEITDPNSFETWPADTFIVRMDNEGIYVSTRAGSTLTLGTRAFFGTAAAHSAGAEVRVVFTSEFLQVIAAEIIATQGWWGVAASMLPAVKTGTHAVLSTDAILLGDATTAGFDFDLPTAAGIKGRLYAISKVDASANLVTIDPSGAETIGGLASWPLSQAGEQVVFVSDGTNWKVLSHFIGLRRHSYGATTDPTTGDDTDDGYKVGSTWFNTTTKRFWVCLDATAAAAKWTVTPFHNLAATTNPAVTDDSGDGYSVGSLWVNTTLDKVFICADAGVGAAIWRQAGAGGIEWEEVTGTSQTAEENKGYIANNAALVTITLPTTAPVGTVVAVAGKGAGGWKVAQNASEQIHFGAVSSTVGTGGSISSNHRRDCVELVCVVADTEWGVRSAVGTITVT